AHPYVRSLEAHGIPHVLVGGRSFHRREEVVALNAALTAIEWPDDELNVYATLRGPLIGLSDETLLCFRQRHGRLNPVRPLAEALQGDDAIVVDALDVLKELHRRRNRRSIAETIEALLLETRAHAALAYWPTGDQALANALSLVDAARSFERRGG